MFTSKGLFSEITCPYDTTCALPNCLFAHSKVSASVPTVPPASESLDGSGEPGPSANGARKRRKIEKGAEDTSNSKAEILEPSQNVKSGIKSLNRPVSPPPLRRGADKHPKPSASRPTVTLPQPKPSPKPLQQALKAETLNPRMLKHSPGSHDLRCRLLKALHDQLVLKNTELSKDATISEEKLILSDQELVHMALDIEERTAIDNSTLYSNNLKNRIFVYKKMSVKDWKDEREKDYLKAAALKAKTAPPPPTSPALEPIETGLSPEEELVFLPRLCTSLEGLSKHGYVTSIPTQDSIDQAKKGVEAAKGWEVCDRCKARFQVFPGRREEDGALASGGLCTYHWGKPYFQDKNAQDPKAKRERKYRCCGQSIGDSAGCTTAGTHVFKVSEVKRLAALLNFVETPPNDAPSTTPVCIDGEMGYTVYGLELIRLTATAWPDGNELLDVLVRPIGEILDLNSQWSGVSPQQMADAVPFDSSKENIQGQLRIVNSPAHARSLLVEHLSPTTPLIGHGLENDLNAARLIHPTIIDTCFLFPHKAGLPYRNGLKMLMQQYLNRKIQTQIVTNGVMEGHDSKEDANAAGDLVKWKIGEKWKLMKLEGWTLEDGKFHPPKGAISPPTGSKGLLTEEFLETPYSEEGVPTTGMKRPITEISGDNGEEGEIAEDGSLTDL